MPEVKIQITSDDEAQALAEDLASDLEDLPNILKEQGWQEALETLEAAEAAVSALIAYLKDKE